MTPTTKDTRRADWKGLNFAGTGDWAVDLQAFTDNEVNKLPDRPASGEGCVGGSDSFHETMDLCELTCALGFCPEPACFCREQGPLEALPFAQRDNVDNIIAYNEDDVVRNQ